MFEYYLSKGFTHFDCNKIILAKPPKQVKDRIYKEETYNSEIVMICPTPIPSNLNTLKNLLVNTSFHSSSFQNKFNVRKEEIINIFSAYVEPLIKVINHPSLLQEWKRNPDAADYERNKNANHYKPSEKQINRIDSYDYWPTSIKETIQWFPFLTVTEHTVNIMETNNGIISSLLNVFPCVSYVKI